MDYEAFQKDRKAALLEKKAIVEALLHPQSKEFFYARRELNRVNFALKRIEENGQSILCQLLAERATQGSWHRSKYGLLGCQPGAVGEFDAGITWNTRLRRQGD